MGLLEDEKELLLGVDCEGISRQRPLSLIQVGLGNHCYVFDLTKVNPFPLGLKSILESQTIIKIFHDFCEDTSALVSQFGVHCERVFDTQIAHRMQKVGSDDPKDSNISLNSLLMSYIAAENDQKTAMVSLMQDNPDLWWQRPLSKEMLAYASQDVLFLPLVYEEMKNLFCGDLKNKITKRFNQHPNQFHGDQGGITNNQNDDSSHLSFSDSSDHDDISVSTNYSSNISTSCKSDSLHSWTSFCKQIFEQTELCQRYAYLNKKISHPLYLRSGTQIKVLLKNYQPYGVYCSLNLGVSGFVRDEYSLQFLRDNHKIGDIITLEIEEDFLADAEMGIRKPLIRLRMPSQPSFNQFHSKLYTCLSGAQEQSYFEEGSSRNLSYSDYYNPNNQGFYFGMEYQSDLLNKITWRTAPYNSSHKNSYYEKRSSYKFQQDGPSSTGKPTKYAKLENGRDQQRKTSHQSQNVEVFNPCSERTVTNQGSQSFPKNDNWRKRKNF